MPKQKIEIEIEVPEGYERLPAGSVIRADDYISNRCHLFVFRRKKRLVELRFRVVDEPVVTEGMAWYLNDDDDPSWTTVVSRPSDTRWLSREEVWE